MWQSTCGLSLIVRRTGNLDCRRNASDEANEEDLLEQKRTIEDGVFSCKQAFDVGNAAEVTGSLLTHHFVQCQSLHTYRFAFIRNSVTDVSTSSAVVVTAVVCLPAARDVVCRGWRTLAPLNSARP